LISSKPYNFSCFYVCVTIYNSEAVRVWGEGLLEKIFLKD
jgi:hypothetical protein